MKKARIIALVLCIAMMLTAVGCSLLQKEDPDQKAIVGTWTSDPIDFTDMLNEEMAASLSEEDLQYFTLENFAFSVVFTFNDDDTYTMNADQDSIDAMTEDITAQFGEGVTAMYTDVAEANNLTVEALLEAAGYEDMDAAIADVTSGFDFTAMADEMNVSGKYLVKDGQLYLLDAQNENTYTDLYNYTLEGDTLTLDLTEEDTNDYGFDFPLVLNR